LDKELGGEEILIDDSKSPPSKNKTQLILEDIKIKEHLKTSNPQEVNLRTEKSQSKKKSSTTSKASYDDRSNQNIKSVFQNLAQFNFTKQNRLVNNLN